MYRKILIAYDGSDGSRAALERACNVAKEYDASITMVWVRGPMPHHATTMGEVDDEREAAEEYFKSLTAHAQECAARRALSISCVCLRGQAAAEIVRHAEKEGFDLIVIGQVGHSGLLERMLGPTADRISETAKCDVLIVRKQPQK